MRNQYRLSVKIFAREKDTKIAFFMMSKLSLLIKGKEQNPKKNDTIVVCSFPVVCVTIKEQHSGNVRKRKAFFF